MLTDKAASLFDDELDIREPEPGQAASGDRANTSGSSNNSAAAATRDVSAYDSLSLSQLNEEKRHLMTELSAWRTNFMQLSGDKAPSINDYQNDAIAGPLLEKYKAISTRIANRPK